MTIEQRMDQLEKRNKRLTVGVDDDSEQTLDSSSDGYGSYSGDWLRVQRGHFGIRRTSEHFGWQLGIFTRWQLPGTGGI